MIITPELPSLKAPKNCEVIFAIRKDFNLNPKGNFLFFSGMKNKIFKIEVEVAFKLR